MSPVPDSELLVIGYRYAFALTSNRQDAEDLLHDAWLRLVSRYGNSPDKPLLFRTIKNLYIDALRHGQVVDNYQRHQRHVTQSENTEVDRYINADLLEFHLNKLKSNEREVLFLSVIEGYTADEISAMTGLVRGTILSLLSRTRKKLRASLSSDAESRDDKKIGNVIPLKSRSTQS